MTNKLRAIRTCRGVYRVLTAKEMTPIVSKTPGRIRVKMCEDEPRSDESIATLRKTTEDTMIVIDIRAEKVVSFLFDVLTLRGMSKSATHRNQTIWTA